MKQRYIFYYLDVNNEPTHYGFGVPVWVNEGDSISGTFERHSPAVYEKTIAFEPFENADKAWEEFVANGGYSVTKFSRERLDSGEPWYIKPWNGKSESVPTMQAIPGPRKPPRYVIAQVWAEKVDQEVLAKAAWEATIAASKSGGSGG